MLYQKIVIFQKLAQEKFISITSGFGDKFRETLKRNGLSNFKILCNKQGGKVIKCNEQGGKVMKEHYNKVLLY